MLNEKIFYFFYSFAHQSEFLDKMIVFFAETLPYILLILAGVFVIFHKDKIDSKNPFILLKLRWKELVLVFFSSISAWLISHLLKNIFMLPRPFIDLPDVSALWVERGYAFPSGHATAFMALAFSIYFIHKKIGYVLIALAVLIGLARIAAGVHFPVDILGGFVLGGVVAYTVKYFTTSKNDLC